jgi:cation transport ATPase
VVHLFRQDSWLLSGKPEEALEMENNAGADRTRRVGHDKDNGNIKVRPEEKRAMRHIMLAAVLFTAGLLTEGYLAAGLCLTAYLMLGWKVLWKAVSGVWHGRIFDENFLMAVATIGALAIGKYAEGTAVMLFCQIGEWFEDYAVNRSKRSIAALMAIRPDHANIAVDGKLRQVRPETVKPGTRIIIKPGERIPLDGQITEGNSILDMSSLTGEPLPYAVSSGMSVISGSINKSGLLQVKTTKSFGESTVMRILALSAQAGDKKSPYGKFHHTFRALLYTGRCCRCSAIGTRAALADRRGKLYMALPCADLSSHIVSLCFGHISAVDVFQRDRRRLKMRHTGKRQQLSGSACPDRHHGF